MIARARCADECREGGVIQVAKKNSRVCARNCSGAQFIAPSRGPIPGHSPAPGPAGDWGGELRGSYGSATSQPRFWSGRWPNHVLVKGVPRVLSLWVDSNPWVQLEPPYRACHPLGGQIEKYISVARVSAYRVYLSWVYTTEQGALSLAQIFRFPRHSRWFWCLWWSQYVCLIIPGWVCHPMYPIYHFPDVYPSLILYSPGGLGVRCVQLMRGRIVKWSIWVHHALYCYVQWRGLIWCR